MSFFRWGRKPSVAQQRAKAEKLLAKSGKGSGLSPKRFTVPGEEKVFLCGCKHAKNAPFCDGTHKRL